MSIPTFSMSPFSSFQAALSSTDIVDTFDTDSQINERSFLPFFISAKSRSNLCSMRACEVLKLASAPSTRLCAVPTLQD
jgi:hypothetical protein